MNDYPQEFDTEAVAWDNDQATPFTEPEVYNSDALEDALLNAGVHPERLNDALPLIDQVIEKRAIRRAMEIVSHIITRLDRTAGGDALKQALSLSNESLRLAAKNCGISPPAMLKQVRRIRKKLGIEG